MIFISWQELTETDNNAIRALVARYPIGYWSIQKEFSGKNRPCWKEKDHTKGGLQTNQQ
ncbi:hypothetical protein [Proteus sp. TJ1640]|uniref:hypothetical protein n=1 Tax=Proteus sp. TJ1640 TaxID=2050968 RepID=UPI001EF69DDA|nr:hypothetical protein [Proteus sp. TJ1640]